LERYDISYVPDISNELSSMMHGMDII